MTEALDLFDRAGRHVGDVVLCLCHCGQEILRAHRRGHPREYHGRHRLRAQNRRRRRDASAFTTEEQRRRASTIRRQLGRMGGPPSDVAEYGLEFRSLSNYGE